MSIASDQPRSDPRRAAVVAAALVLPGVAAAVLALLRDLVDAPNAALVLVAVVVSVAAAGYRIAGALAALSAALWFDFFLTRPYRTFAIAERADVETAVLLLVVGLGVAEVAAWGRRQQSRAERRAGHLAGVQDAVDAMDDDVDPARRAEVACTHLTLLLGLRSAAYVTGPVPSRPEPGQAHLRPDAQVEVDGGLCEVERYGLPVTRPIVVDLPDDRPHDEARGRFVLHAALGSRPSTAQRLAAVAVARWATTADVLRPGDDRSRNAPTS